MRPFRSFKTNPVPNRLPPPRRSGSPCYGSFAMNPRDSIAFVLVTPLKAGNIGAAARALKNMGFADLRIVAPAASRKSRGATMMAVHGRDVLAAAREFRSLAAAVADCSLVVGTTCRPGPYRAGATAVREAAREFAALGPDNRAAIVFGPEDRGLANRELKLCHRLITIPTSPDYASLNLAQAVLIVAYEIMLAAGGGAAALGREAPAMASAEESEAMVTRMAEALVAIGFLPADNPDHIMFAIRAIFGRAGLTRRDVDILSGIARQMRWAAEGGHRTLAAKRASGLKLR
jgi:tRNA/rRNA methyltransferase